MFAATARGPWRTRFRLATAPARRARSTSSTRRPQDRRGERRATRAATHFQNSKNPPSNQSHKQIDQRLRTALLALGERNADAAGEHHVLELRQRDLQLRHDVPFGRAALRPGPQHFDLRRPRAAEAAVLRERGPDRGTGRTLL